MKSEHQKSLETLEEYATVQCGVRVGGFSLEAWSMFIREGWTKGEFEELAPWGGNGFCDICTKLIEEHAR
jgi:hypothetical protein